MSLFDKREQGFEQKFAHDETLRFKAHARRAKLVGLWAAAQMGLSPEESERYAKDLVQHDVLEAGDDDIVRKVRADFDAKGVKGSDHQIRRTLDEMMAQAVKEIEDGR
jgi:hypothetical protein